MGNAARPLYVLGGGEALVERLEPTLCFIGVAGPHQLAHARELVGGFSGKRPRDLRLAVLLESDGQLVRERCGGWKTLGGLLGECFLDYCLKPGRNDAEVSAHWRRLVVNDAVQNLGDPLPSERPLAYEELVENDAHREDVGPAIDRGAAHLLGAHVVDCAHHHAAAREVHPPEFGDAEVHDLGGAVVEHPDVARLDVAVDDAPLVGEGESAADLDDDVELLGQWDRALPTRTMTSRSEPGSSSMAM